MTSLELIERLIADIKNSQNVRGTKTLGMLSGMVFDTLLLHVSNMLTAHQTNLLLFDGKTFQHFLSIWRTIRKHMQGTVKAYLMIKTLSQMIKNICLFWRWNS